MSACLVPTVKPEPGAVKTCFILSGMTSNKPPAAVKAISPRSRVLHQFTGPPQSPNLNPAELIRDELDHTVREKQPTNPQHMWELLSVCLKKKKLQVTTSWSRLRGQTKSKRCQKVHIWARDYRFDSHSGQHVQLLDLFKCPQVRYCT